MISVDGLTVEFGGTTLFSDISFQINEKDRIALMGKNGAGKSTLLKILAGVRQPTRGKVTAPKDCVVAYLPQHLMTEDGRTVFEEASQAFAHLHQMEAEIEAINKQGLVLLQQARSAWAVKHDYECAHAALNLLSQIDPYAACRADADVLLKDINNNLRAQEKARAEAEAARARAEWEFKMRQYEDNLTMTKQKQADKAKGD